MGIWGLAVARGVICPNPFSSISTDAVSGALVKRAAVIVVVTWVIASWCGSANCMTFRIVWNPEEKINVIIGEGPIAQGDKERLEKVISLSGRDRYGNIPLYL